MKRIRVWAAMLAIALLVGCAGPADLKREGNGRKGDYVLVGIGPGDPDLLTARAVSAIRRADLVFCSRETRKMLAGLADFKGKQVLDGYGDLYPFYGKDCSGLTPEERNRDTQMTCESYHERQAEFASLVRSAVADGRAVVLLSQGDPTIYGPDI